MVQASWWLAEMMLGRAAGCAAPDFTFVITDGSKPDRARDTWSARYTERCLRTKYSFQPIRPSGVVSQVLLLRQQP